MSAGQSRAERPAAERPMADQPMADKPAAEPGRPKPGRLSAMIRRDAILAWRNGHVGVALAIMMIMALLIVFLPGDVKREPNRVFLDSTGDGSFAAALARAGVDRSLFAADVDEFESRLSGSGAGIGVVARGGSGGLDIELRYGTGLPSSSLSLLEASIDEVLRASRGEPSLARFAVERLGPKAEPVPLNLKGIPVFLIFEAGILGFLLVAVFVFQEKQEGTIRAYRTSPGGAAAYVAAKGLVFVAVSLVYGAGVIGVGMAMGARPAVAGTLLALAGASATLTLGGLGFACYFSNLSQWFFPGLGVLLLNILPFFNVANPAFDPWWIRVVPAYPYLKLTESLFFGPDTAPSGSLALQAAAWLIACGGFALVSVRKKLLKEAS